jgi:uncharacterized protein (TIGR03435 family)
MKKAIMITVTLVALAVAATIVAKQSVPQVKDSYFDPDTDKLRQLPADLVLVRPTHFPRFSSKTRHIADDEIVTRTLGRNVLLQDVIAEAWDCNPSRVVLHADAPKGGFDFLVTTTSNTREHLQTAIQKQLGYVAHRETRNTEVWVLKMENENSPGLTTSPDNEKSDIAVKERKLHFTHQPLRVVLDGLSQGLKQPVIDQTSLTNFYDFSTVWSPEIQQRMHSGAFDLEGVKKVLASWGLRLEPDTQLLDMFVVEKR